MTHNYDTLFYKLIYWRMVNRNHVGLLNIHLFSKRHQTLLQRKLTHQKHLALYVHIIKVLNHIRAYTRVFQLTTLSPRLDLPGFWPGTDSKREAWLLRTWFDRPIPPVNKLVSLRALRRFFQKFTLHYIACILSNAHGNADMVRVYLLALRLQRSYLETPLE